MAVSEMRLELIEFKKIAEEIKARMFWMPFAGGLTAIVGLASLMSIAFYIWDKLA